MSNLQLPFAFESSQTISDLDLQAADIHGLFQEIESTQLRRFDGILNRSVAREHDERNSGIQLACFFQQIQAAQAWHLQIRKHHNRVEGTYLLASLVGISRDLNVIAPRPQQFRKRVPDAMIILN